MWTQLGRLLRQWLNRSHAASAALRTKPAATRTRRCAGTARLPCCRRSVARAAVQQAMLAWEATMPDCICMSLQRPHWGCEIHGTEATKKRSWPEDFPHENGRYLCRCVHCGHTFEGHKRRVSCKVCASGVKGEGTVPT